MEIQIGLTHTSKCVVTAENTASAMGSGDLIVFATPSMVALMENAAMSAIAAYIPEGSTTVGVKVDISHIRATPISADVNATATVVEMEGRKVVFKIEAFDVKGLIGQGIHERVIVDKERFLSKL